MTTINQYVRTNRRDGRYLETEDGRTFIPNGCNICWPGRSNDALTYGKHLLDELARNGANFARLFMSSSGFDIEPSAGAYSDEMIDRTRAFVAHARSCGIRLKMTLEHFRYVLPEREREHLLKSDFFARPMYHPSNGGPVETMQAYLDTDAGRNLFLRKLDRFATLFAGEPAILGWELWNEFNCIHAEGWVEWTRDMLGELRKRFPNHLVMQSLGSLDCDRQIRDYESLSAVEGQDIAQVHRYVDEGAALKVCSGPVDESVADAMGRLRKWYPDKPLLLAEAGAVEPHHAGPWRHYKLDTDGVILHDVMFGGFFMGGCGCGQNWHWDSYIDKNGLWPAFARFASAISGFDPAAIKAQTFTTTDDARRLRAYGLRGTGAVAVWVRDGQSDWRSEFEQGKPPGVVAGAMLRLPSLDGRASVRCYDPWKDEWSPSAIEGSNVRLPPFRRSIVVRIELKPEN